MIDDYLNAEQGRVHIAIPDQWSDINLCLRNSAEILPPMVLIIIIICISFIAPFQQDRCSWRFTN